MSTAPAALKEPFWVREGDRELMDRVRRKLHKVKDADRVHVDERGTVVAIVDGIVYYNSPSHREEELGV